MRQRDEGPTGHETSAYFLLFSEVGIPREGLGLSCVLAHVTGACSGTEDTIKALAKLTLEVHLSRYDGPSSLSHTHYAVQSLVVEHRWRAAAVEIMVGVGAGHWRSLHTYQDGALC